MPKRKNIDVENLKKIIGIQLEKNLLSMHYIEFNNFEVDILDSCNFDCDKEDRLMLNCGHMIICYLSESGIIGLLHILNNNPYCLQCQTKISHIRIFPEKTRKKNIVHHVKKRVKNEV